MQAPSEEDLFHKGYAQRRLEEHMQWKVAFFQSRPPPPFVPQRRRRREPIASSPVHIFYNRALELISAAGLPATPTSSAAVPLAAASEKVDLKQADWLERMKSEMDRRNPYTDLNICSDPRRTVVMSRFHAKTIEEDVRLFGEQFGRVVNVRLIFDRNGRSRRYGFVQFGSENDVRRAVASSGKRRLHGRNVVIDVERGRQYPGFLPKRIAKAMSFQEKGTGSLLPLPAESPALKRRRDGTLPPAQDSSRATVTEQGPPEGVLECRDDVDAFLCDIMNIA